MPDVQFRSVQIGGGGCLARLVGIFIIIAVLIAIAAGLILVPVVMAVAFVLTSLWSLVSGGSPPWRPAAEGEPLTGDRTPRCPACGFDLSRHGPRGACPECGTLFGFDVDARTSPADSPGDAPALPPGDPNQKAPRNDPKP